jgi:YfiR/HmsC-like
MAFLIVSAMKFSAPGRAVRGCHRGSRMRWFWVWLFLVSGGLVMPQSQAPSEYQVKAAFLYNFGKFVEWPDTAFAGPQAPLVIGVFGDNPFHKDLEQLVAGKTIGGHPVTARFVTAVAGLKTCHIVFVSESKQKDAAQIAAALNGRKVLTVTENMKHFAASGFIINFVTEDDRIRFEINNTAADRAGLTISSKLLSLARPPEK